MNDENRKNDAGSEVMSWVLIGIAFMAFWPLGIFLLFKKLAETGAKTQNTVPPLYAPSEDYRSTARTYEKYAQRTAPKTASGDKSGLGQETFAQRMMRTPKMNDATAKWLKVAGVIIMIVGGMYTYNTLSTLYWVGLTQYQIWNLVANLAWVGAGGVLFANGQRMSIRARRFQKYYAIIGLSEAMPIDRIARASGNSQDKVLRDLQRMVDAGMFGGDAYLDMGLGYFFRSSAAASKVNKQKTAAEPAPKEADEGYSGILRNIRRANDAIADPVLSAKIDRLEEISGRIFRIVEQDKEKEKRIGTFLNYYLPTTQKLLDAYAEFEATGVDGDNLREAKQKIEHTMDAIVEGFEHQLDMLYQSDAMDVSSDIDVMQTMLRRDGARSDFTVGAKAAEKPSAKPSPAPKAEDKKPAAPNLVMRSDGTVGQEEEQ